MLMNFLLASLLLAGGGDEPFRVRAQAPWPFATGLGKEFVVRSAAELLAASPYQPKEGAAPEGAESKALADVTKALKVKDIDWKTRMLVVIRLKKTHPTRDMALDRLVVQGGELTAHYHYWRPVAAREDDPNPVPADRAMMFLVDRFEGKVKLAGTEFTPK